MQNVRGIIIIAVFSVVAFVGGLVKLGFLASIALDSWPGYFVAAYFSPLFGGLVGSIGHLLSAASAGFPLLYWHAAIAILQFLWPLVFGLIVRRIDRWWGFLIAVPIAVVLNGIAAPLIIGSLAPAFNDLLKGLIPVLVLATLVNTTLASLAVLGLRRVKTPGL